MRARVRTSIARATCRPGMTRSSAPPATAGSRRPIAYAFSSTRPIRRERGGGRRSPPRARRESRSRTGAVDLDLDLARGAQQPARLVHPCKRQATRPARPRNPLRARREPGGRARDAASGASPAHRSRRGARRRQLRSRGRGSTPSTAARERRVIAVHGQGSLLVVQLLMIVGLFAALAYAWSGGRRSSSTRKRDGAEDEDKRTRKQRRHAERPREGRASHETPSPANPKARRT